MKFLGAITLIFFINLAAYMIHPWLGVGVTAYLLLQVMAS